MGHGRTAPAHDARDGPSANTAVRPPSPHPHATLGSWGAYKGGEDDWGSVPHVLLPPPPPAAPFPHLTSRAPGDRCTAFSAAPWRRARTASPPPLAAMAEVSFTKRAAAELSRCFNGLAVRAKGGLQHESPATSGNNAGGNNARRGRGGGGTGNAAAAAPTTGRGVGPATANAAVTTAATPRDPAAAVASSNNAVVVAAAAASSRPRNAAEMLSYPEFLSRLFSHFRGRERLPLASVCRAWRDALYDPRHWRDMAASLRCRELRLETADVRRRLLESLERRGVDAVVLVGATDDDLADVVSLGAALLSRARLVALRCSSVSDRGLESLLAASPRVSSLELFGCNELTDAGLWAALRPTVTSLTLADCINVADETLAAVAQLLPALRELNLQAYHVTDASLAHLGGGGLGSQLVVLRLRSCWELTNQGLVQLVQAVPQLRELSLSGCTKISDDGVELLAENMRQLRVLDLSWCPRITDASLEFIACDMTQLQQLTLDRCMQITDVGLGYLSTIPNLSVLYLRWCTQIRDYGVEHLCTMKSLRILSLAGCPHITTQALTALSQLRQLQELELTNCPGATAGLVAFLHEQLPHCLVID
ncbi:hypothetical protein HPB52_021818 [Rhipicephalus sanguineus]|uniref:F-box/LRR-repeat protein 16 n=1 Tax=Rhipicephalus sanguineus TaxID=34632 RepID=A0A9D4STD2_RHISA|nr:hypothetical protein HPB52_021818 [Rhipicephalus sanguineus]